MAHNFVTKERALIVIISGEFLPKYIRPLASDEAKSTRRQILNMIPNCLVTQDTGF